MDERFARISLKRIAVRIICMVLMCIMAAIVLAGIPVFATSCGGVPTTLIECDEGGSGGIEHILRLVIDILSIGVGIASIIGISWAGIQYLTAGDSMEKGQKAKRRIAEIAIGLVCYVVLWGGMQWLLPGGALNINQDNSGVKSIAISHSNKTYVRKAFSPLVAMNDEASNTTYSLSSNDTNIARTLGHSVLCVAPGKATISATAANGVKSSMDINCEETVQESIGSGGSSGGGNNNNSGNGDSSVTVCDDSNIDKKRGLTYEQAKILAMNYGANVNNDSKKHVGRMWKGCNGGGSNCTAFSAFFYNKFTHSNAKGWGDGATGALVASRDSGKPMINYGEKGIRVWSIVARRDYDHYGGYGHTGVVVGRQKDGQWIVVQASCHRAKKGKGNGTESGDGSAFVDRGPDAWSALWINVYDVVWARYVYIGDMIDYCLLADYVRAEK